MKRLVAVSNRVTVPKRGAAPGGLAVGLAAAMRRHAGLWFGWNGQVGTHAASGPELAHRDGITYATLGLARAEYEGYYLGFSNGILWPLFHYMLNGFHYSDEHYEIYEQVNQRFARELGPLLRPDDLIWVHDYHLLLLGQALRCNGVTQPIGLFLHIPFPGIDVLRALPVHRELLEAMLCYDVVGFQTESDLNGFRSAIAALWGAGTVREDGVIVVGTRRVCAEVFAIGVDPQEVQREAVNAQLSQPCRRMVAGLLGRKLMIGVDRLDYSKGLVERFRAYERFLEAHPEDRNHVTYLQIAPLSRTDVRAYASIRRELEQATGRTNGRFADTDWTPIRYLNRNFTHDVLMSFLRTALVGLVTPVRDGMNLVAKEFVAAQDPADPGVLVLSSLAGAARELTSALLVNPYDTRGIANAIHRAFTMPLAERRERHQSLLAALCRNDIHSWYGRFLERLTAVFRHQQAGA
jgi:trehalose 6-phosphate synthase